MWGVKEPMLRQGQRGIGSFGQENTRRVGRYLI